MRQIGELPYPLTHAAGASLNGWFYVIGGRGESLSDQRASILAVDPHSGAVHAAGRLPRSALGRRRDRARQVTSSRSAGATRRGSVYDSALTLLPAAR